MYVHFGTMICCACQCKEAFAPVSKGSEVLQILEGLLKIFIQPQLLGFLKVAMIIKIVQNLCSLYVYSS